MATFQEFQDGVAHHLVCRGVDRGDVSTRAMANEHGLPEGEVIRILEKFGAFVDLQVLLLTETRLGRTRYSQLLFDWARLVQRTEKRLRRKGGAPSTR